VAPDVGHFDVPELAQAMKLEWWDEALADLDRFVEFLNQQQPSLAPLVAKEIVDRCKYYPPTRSWEGRLPVAKNIVRSYYRFLAQLMCFNIASMANVL
jgi:hypothetical protein